MMPFQFSYDGKDWSSDDITGVEFAKLEEQLKVDFAFLNPLRSMRHRLAFLGLLLRRERSEDEGVQIVDRRTLVELNDMVRWGDKDDLPTEWQDGIPLVMTDEPGTAGSSSAPAVGVGLPT